mmetsp:Transcript_22030/g.70912  ORF Transcript_22030/g.70912 Transcript_22030/m.70912 type:complete len:250 (+) Transcript_22030:538-1287(+)
MHSSLRQHHMWHFPRNESVSHLGDHRQGSRGPRAALWRRLLQLWHCAARGGAGRGDPRRWPCRQPGATHHRLPLLCDRAHRQPARHGQHLVRHHARPRGPLRVDSLHAHQRRHSLPGPRLDGAGGTGGVHGKRSDRAAALPDAAALGRPSGRHSPLTVLLRRPRVPARRDSHRRRTHLLRLRVDQRLLRHGAPQGGGQGRRRQRLLVLLGALARRRRGCGGAGQRQLRRLLPRRAHPAPRLRRSGCRKA